MIATLMNTLLFLIGIVLFFGIGTILTIGTVSVFCKAREWLQSKG
jgi:cytochrome c biogenesis protein CcdA